MTRTVEFRRWNDPFIPEEHHEEDELKDGYDWDGPKKQSNYRGIYAATPAGFFPLSEANLPSRQFSFWMGDTNFDLDRTVVDAAKAVPGVEILQVQTRYRFWLGIGRAFHDERVKAAVRKAMVKGATPEGPPLYWVVVKFENGATVRITGETKKAALRKAERLGEVMATSWSATDGLFGEAKATGDFRPGVRGGPGEPGQPVPPEVHLPEVREQAG